MKKAIKVLAVAALAALVFAGCKTGTQDVSLDTGTTNYDLAGKKLVATNNDYYTKIVTTSVTQTVAGITTTATTNVQTQILARVTTTTVNFDKANNAFTVANTTVYQAGADGDYRTVFTTSTSGTTITNVTTSYRDISGSTIDAVYTGLASLKTNDNSITGTWKKYDQQDSATDGQTVIYKVLISSNSQATTTTTPATTNTETTSATVASNTKKTFTASNTTTSSSTVDTTYYDAVNYYQNSTKKDSAGVECDFVWLQINSWSINDSFYVYAL